MTLFVNQAESCTDFKYFIEIFQFSFRIRNFDLMFQSYNIMRHLRDRCYGSILIPLFKTILFNIKIENKQIFISNFVFDIVESKL